MTERRRRAGGRAGAGSTRCRWTGDGWELIGPGLHRTYRRGRKRLRAVEEEASVTNLHELRKRVKDLWYQLRLIRDADKHMLGPWRTMRTTSPITSATITTSRCSARPSSDAAPPSPSPGPQASPARADRPAPRRAPVRRDLARRAHLRREAEALHQAAREALGGLARARAGRRLAAVTARSGRPRLLLQDCERRQT